MRGGTSANGVPRRLLLIRAARRPHDGRRGMRAARAIAVAITITVGTALWTTPALALDPTFTRQMGGPLHAEMYPSGLEVGTDGTIVIADTGNNQVAKYSAAGQQLWRIGRWGPGTGQFDNPRDIAIDSNNDIYVADTRNSRIVKLAPSGTWLDTYAGVAGDLVNYELGVSIHDDILYIADTGRKKVRRIDVAAGGWTELAPVVADPNGGQYADSGCRNLKGIRDADADSAGNVYVTGYLTNDIAKFDPSGHCVDWGVTGTGPGQFRTPYGVRVAVDPVAGGEVLFVADGLNHRVQEFTLNGTFLTQIGIEGDPTDPGTVDAVRRVAAANDGSGDIWLADLWGNRVERYTRGPGGYQYAQTIGAVMPLEDDGHVFQETRQVAVGPDGVVNVIDTVHHRFVRMDRSGHILGICGTRASDGAELGKFNWPRGLAIDDATGQIWVADTKQNRIQIVRPDCTGIQFIGDFTGGTALNQFDWPYGIAIRQSDHIAFVTDTQNNRIKAYDVATRAALSVFGSKGTGFAQFKLPAGIAVSPVDGHIFVADSQNDRIKELSSADGITFTTVRNITAGGLSDPEGVAVDPQGRIYIADSGNDRIVILDANRAQIATISGLDHPSNVAIDPNGTFYVSDTYHDRVLAYGWPAPDVTKPTATLTSPAPGQTYTGLAAITFRGTATDNIGVTAARVAIKNVATNLWWHSDGTWSSVYQLQAASLAAPGAASSSWSYAWTPPATGSYSVLIESADAAGNVNTPKPTNAFTVTNTPPDTTLPTATMTAPAQNQAYVGSNPITFNGSASDNVGVTAARVAIKDTATNLWWRANNTWGTYQAQAATLAAPGATSTTWSYTWTPPMTGSFSVLVESVDAAGNVAVPKPTRAFTVSNTAPDTVAPNGLVAVPASNQSFPHAAVLMSGSATDNVGVSNVNIAIKNRTTGQWWSGSGWQATFKWFAVATLGTPGGTSTGWQYSWNPPAGAGSYALQVRADDAAGNIDPTQPFVNFTVAA